VRSITPHLYGSDWQPSRCLPGSASQTSNWESASAQARNLASCLTVNVLLSFDSYTNHPVRRHQTEVGTLSSRVMLLTLNPYLSHYTTAFAFSIFPYLLLYQCSLQFTFRYRRATGLPRSVPIPLCALGPVSTPRVLTSLRWTSSERPILTLYRFGPGVSPAFTCYS
jgi:hypothetical protein